MFRIGLVAASLIRGRGDVEAKQTRVNNYRERRIEHPEDMYGEFGDQEEGTQDADG